MQRTIKILDILSSNKRISIKNLAELLAVSKATLRKDLIKLEKRGIVHLSHGCVSLEGADNTGKRIAFNYLIKRKIAKLAAQIVEDDETIMIESGSCCALFAEELVFTKKNITIITNSVFITNYLSKYKQIKIILLGGFFQQESQMLIGPMTIKHSENLYFNKFFLGTNGYNSEQGFTGIDHLCTEAASELANRAKNIFILTESTKFNNRGAYNLIQHDKLTGVFTDDHIPEKDEAILIQNNVQVYKVPSKDEKIRLCKLPGLPPFIYKE
ncbi:MAG: DeoR/GlpR family DNA-binding transcription regulator [Treponema sp.]|nr:DeoR/GlpR family DNA-binding transcription regulator [Treponema sp.]MCL2252142.1 DeoR/GlpR family DNA-binding transcription regulator [Treponema sp.]